MICYNSVGLKNVENDVNPLFLKHFRSPKGGAVGLTRTCPAECAEPMEAQALSLSPCRTTILTRHLWGGRIEDACGEVTGHPIEQRRASILGGLVGCLGLRLGPNVSVKRCIGVSGGLPWGRFGPCGVSFGGRVGPPWVTSVPFCGRMVTMTWPWRISVHICYVVFGTCGFSLGQNEFIDEGSKSGEDIRRCSETRFTHISNRS